MSEFVSVTGRFTAHRTDSGDVVLRARYGSGEPSAHVKITCAGSEGRGEFRNEDYYTGEFQARCLGKVRTWISGTGARSPSSAEHRSLGVELGENP
jgi:hypothetical protein